jgi:hypothetical protein
MTVLSFLAACRPDPTPRPRPCDAVSRALFADGESLAARVEGCGALEAHGVEALGTGPLTVSLYADGAQVVARVVAGGAATLDGLRLEGTFEVDGRAPGLGHALSLAGEPAAPPGPTVAGAWAGSWGRADGGTLVTGTLGGGVPVEVEIADGAFSVTWGGDLGLSLEAGEDWWFDPWYAALGPSEPTWRDWADAVGDAAGGPRGALLPGGLELAGPPDVDGVPALADDAPGAELVTMGGWPSTPGEPADDPVSPAAWARAVHAAGRRAGIVVAPFAVARSGSVASAHPEWLVRAGDDPLEVDGAWQLDPTDPGAAAWVASWVGEELGGFDVVVVSGLAGVGAPGTRDGARVGSDAVRAALAVVRGASPDALLVADGAPLLTVVGHADAARIPPDPADRDGWISAVASALPLGPHLALDPAPLDLSGGSPAEAGGLVAAAALAGPVRVRVRQTVDAQSRRATSDPFGALGAARSAVLVEGWWGRGDAPTHVVLLAPADRPIAVAGPGGREAWTGEQARPGDRELAPSTGEVWLP